MPNASCRCAARRVLGALTLGAVLVVGTTSPAGAHASLVAIDPPDGARLDESPAAVTLTFSEPVSAELGGVRVLDDDGGQVQRGAARVDGTKVVVDLAPELPEGTYVISYRVVSEDGHPVRGASTFGVGSGPVDTDALGRIGGTGDDVPWDVTGAIARGLAYAGVLVAAGGALFLVHAHRAGAERVALVRDVRLAAAIGAAASLVVLPVQAALGTGQGPLSLLDDGVLGEVVADGVGLGLALALAGLAVTLIGLGRSRPLVVAGAVIASASFAATGHNRVDPKAALATVADSVHLVAAAVWAGGVLLLWLTVRARRRAGGADPLDTAGVVARFSQVATAAILAVGVAGTALGWTQLERPSALWETRYGLFLLSKLILVVGIAAIGAYNHVRLVPALHRAATAALDRLHLTLRLEAIGLTGLLAITSVLVFTTPARDEQTEGPIERLVELGDAGSAQLVVSPGRVGVNQIHLFTYDTAGRVADIADGLTIELALPAAQLGPIDREATRAGPAHFVLDTGDLAVAGDWLLTIRARIDRYTEATGTTTMPIGAP